MEPISLETKPRTVLGKKVKNLRKSGITPVHLYGLGGPSLSLQSDSMTLRNVLARTGRTSPVSVAVDGDSEGQLALVRDVAAHPVSGEIQHVDFLRVQEDRPIEAPVQIVLVGEAPATRGGGAVITQILRTLMVRALPLEIPDRLEADISVLRRIGSVLRVRDLRLPSGVAPAGHPEDVIARAQKQREVEAALGAEEEELEEEEEGAGEDGGEETAGEGEASGADASEA